MQFCHQYLKIQIDLQQQEAERPLAREMGGANDAQMWRLTLCK